MTDPRKQISCKPWPNELEQLALRASHQEQPGQHPQAEAIALASVWQMPSPESADAALAGSGGDFIYRRDGHPNERSLASKLASLHGARDAMLTAQGMSAIAAVAMTVLKPGADVWIANELYGKSHKLFSTEMKRWQVNVRCFDPTEAAEVAELLSAKVDLVLVESISNPRMNIADLTALAQATHAAGGYLLVDNTFATHLLCRPLQLGADLVVESLGKIVNGHSDTMLGLLAVADEQLGKRLRNTVSTFGMASSPMDCYLTHRSLHSLGVRMERACHNALALARGLDKLPQVRVDYPGLVDHPQHELANQQLSGGYGWMLALHLPAERERVLKVFEQLRPEIGFVPSLGDANTTISHPVSTSHRGFTESERTELGISYGTIRISCGIETTEWLVDKFVSAVQLGLS